MAEITEGGEGSADRSYLFRNSTPIIHISGKGKLANCLKESVDTTVKKWLHQIKFSTFENHFKEIYQEDPSSLKLIHTQLLSQLQEYVQLEINKFCEKVNIGQLLDQLEDITFSNVENHGRNVWRPSGNPYNDRMDHEYPIKLKHKEKLAEVLKTLDTQNEGLLNTLEQNHFEILKNKTVIEDMMRNYKMTSEHLQICANQFETEFLSIDPDELENQ